MFLNYVLFAGNKSIYFNLICTIKIQITFYRKKSFFFDTLRAVLPLKMKSRHLGDISFADNGR